MSKSVLPMFSSMSFMVFGLAFRSLIHFECIFLNGVEQYSNCIPLHIIIQFSQHHLLKRLSFSCCMFLPPCHRLGDRMCMGLFLKFLSYSVDLYFYFYASTILLWLLEICSIVWSLRTLFVQLCFLFFVFCFFFAFVFPQDCLDHIFFVSIKAAIFAVLMLWKMLLVIW